MIYCGVKNFTKWIKNVHEIKSLDKFTVKRIK